MTLRRKEDEREKRERGKERREEETFLNLEKIEYTLFRENYFCEETTIHLKTLRGQLFVRFLFFPLSS